MVLNSSCPSNDKSNVRPKMCMHKTSNTAETAIQVAHAVEETHLATVESTLQQVHRTTPVVNPAAARPRKNLKGTAHDRRRGHLESQFSGWPPCMSDPDAPAPS